MFAIKSVPQQTLEIRKQYLNFHLVSRNFLESEFIKNNELKYFLEEAAKERVRIFPISISRIEDGKNPLREIQFVNDPESPFDELSDESQHAVLNNMVNQLIGFMRKPDEFLS